MYLLDTNVISELRRNRPHGAVLAWINSVGEHALSVSAATFGELQNGIEITRARDPKKAQQLEGWVDEISGFYRILPMDDRIFRVWARLMQGQSGHLATDAMIAATAAVHGLTVATRDETDFGRFGTTVFNPFSAPP